MSWSSELPAIAAGMEAKAAAAVAKTAADVEGSAKGLARVDTGNMRNSIQTQMTGPTEARVNCGADYGIYNEFGTHKMSAQPFMVPAAEQHRGSFIAACRQIVS